MWGGAGGRRHRPATPSSVDISPIAKKLIGSLHRHTAKIGNKMGAVSVTCYVAFGTSPSILSAKGKHVTAMTTPVRPYVGNRFEPVRDAVIYLLSVIILIRR